MRESGHVELRSLDDSTYFHANDELSMPAVLVYVHLDCSCCIFGLLRIGGRAVPPGPERSAGILMRGGLTLRKLRRQRKSLILGRARLVQADRPGQDRALPRGSAAIAAIL
jgi:hypothetical protein